MNLISPLVSLTSLTTAATGKALVVPGVRVTVTELVVGFRYCDLTLISSPGNHARVTAALVQAKVQESTEAR